MTNFILMSSLNGVLRGLKLKNRPKFDKEASSSSEDFGSPTNYIWYLEKKFRNRLFSQAYRNIGESLGALALAVGYHGKGRNGYVRNMWLGKVPVSSRKIQKIARLAGIPLSEVFEHRVDKQHNLEIKNWVSSYRLFAQQSKETATTTTRDH